jgi:hypothetical protein
LGADVTINTVITRPNFRHLPEISLQLPHLGASGIRFMWPKNEGCTIGFASSLIPNPELVRPFVERAIFAAEHLKRHVEVEWAADFRHDDGNYASA